jgi:hypothetical protein
MRYLFGASLIASGLIAGSVGSVLAADLPLPPIALNVEKPVLVKMAGRSIPTKVAAAERPPVPTGGHRYTFPIVLGIAY